MALSLIPVLPTFILPRAGWGSGHGGDAATPLLDGG